MSNIWIAASDNQIDAVKKFISQGLTANSKDPHGYTPIHAAASYGHLDLLDYLINEAEGDVNIQDEDGDTPLHAVESALAAAFLVEKLGADPKIKNSEDQTPLQKHEEEDEFPEVISYLKSLEEDSSSGLNSSTGVPETTDEFMSGTSIRYQYESVDNASIAAEEDTEESIERRKLLENIMTTNPEQREERLKQFVHGILQEHGQSEESEDVPETGKKHRH